MPKIDAVWAFVMVEADGGEGIPAFQVGGTWFPLIAADQARISSLTPMAQQIASMTKTPITLYRFGGEREVVRVIEP